MDIIHQIIWMYLGNSLHKLFHCLHEIQVLCFTSILFWVYLYYWLVKIMSQIVRNCLCLGIYMLLTFWKCIHSLPTLFCIVGKTYSLNWWCYNVAICEENGIGKLYTTFFEGCGGLLQMNWAKRPTSSIVYHECTKNG